MTISKEYFDAKINEMPKDVLEKAVSFLKDFITEDAKKIVIELCEKEGINWIGMNHHFWGTGVRNALRSHGLTDDLLPDKNWDDYYVPVIEIAVGVRDMP